MTNQKLTSCEKSYFLLRLPSWFLPLFSPVKSRISSQVIAPVSRVIHAIQLASETNLRYYVAALLIAGLAPFSQVVYQFFNEHEGTGYWNTFYFLKSIGTHTCILFLLAGVFIAWPTSHKFKYVVIVPSAFSLSRIIWYASVTDNAGHNAFTPIGILILGTAICSVAYVVFDFLMWLHFHFTQGKLKRAEGVLMSSAFDDATARQVALRELRAANNQQLA